MSGFGAILMLLFAGLAAGGMLVVTVDRLLVWPKMTVVEYATDFRRHVKHLDPMMPIFISLSGIGVVLFALSQSGVAAILAWVALGCLVLIMAASVTIAEPVNSKFRRLPEGTPPEGAERYRVFWSTFHTARAVVSVTTFLLLVLAVAPAK